MRIYFDKLTLPKKAAKRIQKHFSPEDSPFEQKLPLSKAQEWAARMLGYDDWYELQKITKSKDYPPSDLDEEASSQTQNERINFQADVLGSFLPQTEPILLELALKFRVSARNSESSKFSHDGYRQNTLLYWEPYGGNPEWRFMPSGRSQEKREMLDALLIKVSDYEINFQDYIAQLERLIESQPENITAYLYILEACDEYYAWEVGLPYLAKLESAILMSIPDSYPMKRKVPSLIWGTIDNRDYLRSIYHLARFYYANEKFKKSKEWFLFLKRCSEIEIGDENFFLIDLRLREPEGDLHILEEKEMYSRYFDIKTGKRLKK